MALVTYPIQAYPSAFRPKSFQLRLDVNQRAFGSPFGGSEQVVDMLNDRWAASVELDFFTRDGAAQYEAFVNSMRGQANHTELYHFARTLPRGTLRGSPRLLPPLLQGASSLQIAAVNGETLLAGDMLSVGGLLVQCASDTVAGPDGVMAVPIVNRLRRDVMPFSRASTATYVDDTGAWRTAAVNEPRIVNNRLIVEAEATNCAPGTDSDALTTWTNYLTGTAAVTRQVVTDPQFGPVLRLTKTAGAVLDRAGIRTNLLGMNGVSFVLSCWAKRSSGATGQVYVDANRLTGGVISAATLLQGGPTDSWFRSFASASHPLGLAGGGVMYIWLDGPVGTTVDIKLPNVTLGTVLSSAFPAGATVATRAADNAGVRASTGTYVDAAGVLQTAAAHVARYTYFGGKNIYSGPVDLVAGPGVPAASHFIKTATSNPAGLHLGETITVSARVYQDAASAAEGVGKIARFFCRAATSAGVWQAFVYLDSVSVSATGRASATLTLPALASDMDSVLVGVSHGGGDGSLLGTVRADAIMVERGAVATAYEPGARLLVESAASNLALQSQVLNIAPWSGPVSVSAAAESYRGFAPFWTLTKTLSSGSEFRAQDFGAVTAGQPITLTLALLAGSVAVCGVGLYDNPGASWGLPADSTAEVIEGPGAVARVTGALFDVSGLSATIPTVVRITRTYQANTTSGWSVFYPGSAGSGTIGHSAKITRVQVEAGPVATSYIPTTTAVVTRAADELPPVVWDKPTAKFRLVSATSPRHQRNWAQGVTMDFVEAI